MKSRLANYRAGKGNTVLIILAIVGGLCVVACLACGGITYFGLTTGMDMVAELVKEQYGPAIEENIGEVQSMKINFTATGEGQQEFGSDQILAFDIVGTEGDGTIYVEQGGQNQFVRAILRTDEGDVELSK